MEMRNSLTIQYCFSNFGQFLTGKRIQIWFTIWRGGQIEGICWIMWKFRQYNIGVSGRPVQSGLFLSSAEVWEPRSPEGTAPLYLQCFMCRLTADKILHVTDSPISEGKFFYTRTIFFIYKQLLGKQCVSKWKGHLTI